LPQCGVLIRSPSEGVLRITPALCVLLCFAVEFSQGL
jgi:hypothetical protein